MRLTIGHGQDPHLTNLTNLTTDQSMGASAGQWSRWSAGVMRLTTGHGQDPYLTNLTTDQSMVASAGQWSRWPGGSAPDHWSRPRSSLDHSDH